MAGRSTSLQDKMKQINILRCGDQNYWAYHWIAQEYSRYSRHNVKYAKWDNVDLNGIDVIYIHGPNISQYHAKELPLIAKEKGIKVIGAYSSNPEHWNSCDNRTYSHADLIVAISPQTYSFCKFHYTNIPVIFMPESVDTNFFKSKEFNKHSYTVGWAGSKERPVKRGHMLKYMDYKVISKADWLPEIRSLSLNQMIDFYHSIDVLILTSLSEAQPRVVMEAMACGLPVIATDVGSMRMLLDPEWIVPALPEEEAIEQLNHKLHILHEDVDLREQVGKRNLNHIRENWSWANSIAYWDDMFFFVLNNRIPFAMRGSKFFMRSHALDYQLYEEADKYFRLMYQKTKGDAQE